ncbi:MbtH family NRPS accessory protein [Mycetohabitans sp. B46]|uniref:MbtH family NRPS accessory protein n=1 Tax=Mycetohabitans sp. B46 TaxID=2772536 RepID=UPI003FCFE8CB
MVAVNAEPHHALWPSFVDVPAGWQTGHGTAMLQACLDYVHIHWMPMRLKSLAKIE